MSRGEGDGNRSKFEQHDLCCVRRRYLVVGDERENCQCLDFMREHLLSLVLLSMRTRMCSSKMIEVHREDKVPPCLTTINNNI